VLNQIVHVYGWRLAPSKRHQSPEESCKWGAALAGEAPHTAKRIISCCTYCSSTARSAI
jgi:hypothetical protein